MANNYEYNFNDTNLSLISGSLLQVNDFDPSNDSVTGDYIRMRAYRQDLGEGTPQYVFQSNLYNEDGTSQLQIYEDASDGDDLHGKFFLKPNESLDKAGAPSATYTLKFDFLRNLFDSRELVGEPCTDVNVPEGCNENYGYLYFSQQSGGEPDGITPFQNPYFIVKDISISGREVRLLEKSDDDVNAFSFWGDVGSIYLDYFQYLLGNPLTNNYTYNFQLTYRVDKDPITIVNYVIDETTQPGYRSIVLKLTNSIRGDIGPLSVVKIEKELLNTQRDEIVYISTIQPTLPEPGALEPDETAVVLDYTSDDLLGSTPENYNDLTSSLHQLSLVDTIVSSSNINLNINYNDFSNYTFFSSAKSKLENFKTKVETLETYYSELSSSLSDTIGSGSITLDSEASSLRSRRKILFDNIRNEISNFTPYEKFLYFDGQLSTSASAPGVGQNLAKVYPIDKEKSDRFNGLFGFPVVYKLSGSADSTPDEKIYLTRDTYRAEHSPFFNYSGSVYMSFLVKGDESIRGNYSTNGSSSFIHENTNNVDYDDGTFSYKIPQDCLGSGSIEDASGKITGSEWRRYIIEASQSYWRPTSVPDYDTWDMNNDDFDSGNAAYEVLSGSNVSGSYPIQTHGIYNQIATYRTGSHIPFSGSIMPAGDLFNLHWETISQTEPIISSSYITDFKITKKDPSSTYPFSSVYKVSSTEFTDWYNALHDSASKFDEDNIHSLYNNLPEYFRENEDENKDLITFISMIGEHFDLIRNYIDNYSTFYKRNYNENESVPRNLLPILADNLGWQLINPFTGSLAEYFGNVVGSDALQEGGQSVNDIKDNTWRKVLNNLIYIYKSKGTLNSIRALLNVYGYPPNSLTIQEYGGSLGGELSDGSIPVNFKADSTNNVFDLGRSTSSLNYIEVPEYLPGLFTRNKPFTIDLWQNGNNADGIEFVLKKPQSTNDQILLLSSGSAGVAGEHLWDLSLEYSSSYNRLVFRLSNEVTGSDSISSNAVSMSSNYLTMSNGSLWNVLLQRLTASISGTGTNNYELHVGHQVGRQVKDYSYITMSVSGGTSADANYYANQNWPSGSTLHIGHTFTGSISEFRTWNKPLSSSTFVEHVFNKRSVKGNSFDSFKKDLIIHYKFNEYGKAVATGSNRVAKTQWIIKDSNVKGPSSSPKDFSVTRDGTLLTGVSGSLYDGTNVTLYKLSPQVGMDTRNSNKVLLDSNSSPVRNLNPFNRSERRKYDNNNIEQDQKRNYSLKLDLTHSPSSIIDSFIYDKIGGFNLYEKINPSDVFSSSYADLEKFSQEFFDFYDFELKINDFIRQNSGKDKKELYRLVSKVIPARVNTSTGVVLKSHILDKPKIQNYPISVSTGSIYNMDIDINDSVIVTSGSHFTPYEVKVTIADSGSQNAYITQSFTIFQPYLGSVDMDNQIVKESTHFVPYENIVNVIDSGSTLDYLNMENSLFQTYDKSIGSLPVSSSTLFQPYGDIVNSYVTGSSVLFQTYNKSLSSLPISSSTLFQPYSDDINLSITESFAVFQPYVDSITSLPVSSSTLFQPYDEEIRIIDSGSNQSIISQSYSLIQPYNISINNLPISESSLKQPYEISIDLLPISESSLKQPHEISINNLPISESSLKQPHEISINNLPISSSFLFELHLKEISVKPAESSAYISPYAASVNVYTTSGNVQPFRTGSNTFIRDNWLKSFRDLHKEWGRGDNDTHFIPMSKWDHLGSKVDTTDTSSNVAHIEKRYTFSTVGDFETISSSLEGARRYTDFSNIDMFKYQNFTNINKHANFSIHDEIGTFKYDTYRTGDGTLKYSIDGRPIGKTAFYATKSNGDIVYPVNHWINYGRDPYIIRLEDGTQNTNPGYFPHSKYEDLSTASFYTVNVTGKQRAIIRDGSVRKFGSKDRRSKK